MRAFRLLIPLLIFSLLFSCCTFPGGESTEPSTPPESSTPPSPEPTPLPTQPAETEPADPFCELVSTMTLREKVGQLFIIRPDALDFSLSQEVISDSKSAGATALTAAMTAALAEYPVGGFVMFSKNITDPEQITAFNAALESACSITPFLAVDEEGGLVARLANSSAFDLPTYRNAATVGATGDISQAFSMGTTIGTYLKEYGFNLDFAPVADVNTNPDNPIIGTRAFSSDATVAASMSDAMADGLNSQNVIAVFKHFPGHGDTNEDSHTGIAISYKTEAEMMECEWLPFLNADNSDFIMVGHIAVPSITGDLTPATLSSQVVTDILKGTLGFEGLVITDSLEMDAVADDYTSGDAALAALRAGCDVLLMPENLQKTFDAIVDAVETGSFSLSDLDSRVTRILRFKAAYGLLDMD